MTTSGCPNVGVSCLPRDIFFLCFSFSHGSGYKIDTRCVTVLHLPLVHGKRERTLEPM